MGDKSGITWTDATWNPIVGCSIVSPGCTNCYAMKWAAIKLDGHVKHYAGTTKIVNGNAVWTGKVAKAPDHIFTAPMRWKKPRMVFVNSMGDVFHEDVPDAWIDRLFTIMALCPQHTFQVLTKRSKRMREYMDCGFLPMGEPRRFVAIEDAERKRRNDFYFKLSTQIWPLPNVWLGVSCEDQARADERIPDLLATPAAVRFVSAEPLLGPINFAGGGRTPEGKSRGGFYWLTERPCPVCATADNLKKPREEFSHPINCGWRKDNIANFTNDNWKRSGIDWVIVGGESGDGFRPMQIEWAESIKRQCQDVGTKMFFKQDSSRRPGAKGRASDELWACKEFPI